MAHTDVTTRPAVRASDADRERVAAILRRAAGQRLLTPAEVDERLAAVYAATYQTDLRPLTADLPGGGACYQRAFPVRLVGEEAPRPPAAEFAQGVVNTVLRELAP